MPYHKVTYLKQIWHLIKFKVKEARTWQSAKARAEVRAAAKAREVAKED